MFLKGELQTSGFVVGAPAFMRGKERFSAPGNSLDSIMRFSAGNARPVIVRALKGTTFRSYVNYCKQVRLLALRERPSPLQDFFRSL
jgi:hypothetical protein